MPKVSIFLTSYNHSAYIGQAIESALNQSFTDYELFIADDGSTDNSWEIIQNYRDPRIITCRREENRQGGMLWELLPSFKGQYVSIHHSDDSWEPDKLQKQVDYMDAHPGTIACFTHVQFINEKGGDFTPPESHPYYKIFDQPNRNRFEWLRFFFDHGNALCHPSILIRKEAYESFNLSSRGLKQLPDFIMWIRVCLAGEIYVLQKKLTKFRLHLVSETNTSGDNPDAHIRLSEEFFFICDDLYKVSNNEIFLKVFPEYENKNAVPEFIVSRLMIEKGYPPAQLYGIKKLFGLINDPASAQKIKDWHNYTDADFKKETGEIDPFSRKRYMTFLNASLYIDYGNGYTESDKLEESVYVRPNSTFYAKFNLPENKNVIELRFDPDEGHLWDISIDSVVVDGEAQRASAFNSSFCTDGYDSFFTRDPIYLLTTPSQVKEVEICGKVRVLSIHLFDAIKRENASLQNKLDTIKSPRTL